MPIDWENYCKPDSSEEAHQIALFGWAAENVNNFPALKWLFHIPNGGQRNKREAGRLKAGGVKAGVPDIMLPLKTYCNFNGAFFELKLEKYRNHKNGGCSEEQIKWIGNLRQEGYYVAVCYGWKEARAEILRYCGYGKAAAVLTINKWVIK